MTGHISIITATKPARLSKAFRLGTDGQLIRFPGGNLTAGTIAVQEINGLADLATTLKTLRPAQALVHGVPINPATRIVTRKMFDASGRPEGTTPRTNDAFQWPQGGGVMMLDYDPSASADALDRDRLVEAIRQTAPGLSDAAMLWWPSASSCIWQGDRELRGIRGQRLYILVQDAADIPRAGRVLVERLWLAGHGHIEISASGALLERTLVDASVWQPSRLDFAGGAYCASGLEQRRGEPVIIEGSAEHIDSRAALPDLTTKEAASLAVIKSEARAVAHPEAQDVKNAWITARVAEMVKPEDSGDPEAAKQAEGIARRALETGVLAGDFLVPVQIGGEIELVSVGDLLDRREVYHNCLTRDPIEPYYDGGRMVGRLFLMQARPVLYSFAHGGRTYRLHRAPARIELVKGHTAEAANAAIDLLRRDPVAFDFGGQLALAENGRLHPLCEHGLAHHLGAITQFWRFDSDGVAQDADPPAGLVRQIIALGDRRRLKPLDGVITGPTIRLDGSVLDRPGYDATTCLLFDPMDETVPAVPMRPTMAEARAALDTLMHPFATFPFVDAGARGALLAALLTACVRPVLPTAPAFAFDAPIQGSGKTLLASCVGALAEGRAPDVWPHTQGRDDEETRKRLFTALRTGGRALIWDNVTGTFDSASMAAFITADAMVDRVLGKSEAIRIPNRALLILTGNNLSLAGDLPRRVIICRIDPETDQPFARQFDLDPLAHVLDNRTAMMAAACILIRARFEYMDTAATGRLASFEAWDHLVRQTVCWADSDLAPGQFGDPMDLVREAQAADPEADAVFALLDALRDQFGNREFTAKEAQVQAKASMMQSPLETALLDIAGDRALASVKSLGRVLKNREGRIVHGMRLRGRHDTHAGARAYRVEVMTNDAQERGNPGLTAITGFVPVNAEFSGTSFNRALRETNPLNPSNPETDQFGPEAWT